MRSKRSLLFLVALLVLGLQACTSVSDITSADEPAAGNAPLKSNAFPEAAPTADGAGSAPSR